MSTETSIGPGPEHGGEVGPAAAVLLVMRAAPQNARLRGPGRAEVAHRPVLLAGDPQGGQVLAFEGIGDPRGVAGSRRSPVPFNPL